MYVDKICWGQRGRFRSYSAVLGSKEVLPLLVIACSLFGLCLISAFPLNGNDLLDGMF
jgi:hypothetical protein